MDYAAARAELLARPGPIGPAARRALVGLTDDWLTELFVASGSDAHGCALVAVGGYGRRELAPGSDLDLLFLTPVGSDAGELSESIWYPIWDSGMKLDHSVRTPAQARQLAGQDLKVVLGLLDARTVAGDPELTAGLRSAVLADWRAMASRRLDELHQDVRDRTARAGELSYLLEPDLKESYGGLRDLTILRAIEASWVITTEHRSLENSAQLLLDARDALHAVTGRASDRLLLQEQGPVAQRLGMQDADELLRSINAAGRAIAYACDVAWHRVDRATSGQSHGLVRRLRGTRRSTAGRTPLADGVVVQEDEAVLALDARPDRDPVLLLRAAAAAAQEGIPLSPHAVERLATQSAPMPVPWPSSARNALVSLLGAGRSALPVWEALEHADLISRLIPQWAVVRSAPQRNPVHTYTVDRHLLEAAAAAAGLTRKVSRPDLLLVAAMLHDIGKAQPGDHTQVGVEIMRELAPHMGFDEADSAILVSLVANHLLLPETATRRDLDDPMTAELVAKAVGSQLELDLLHQLTIADAAATGPAAWSEWKASLINRLVGLARAVLAGEPVRAEPALTPEQLALADLDGVQVAMAPAEGAWTVTVATDDRTGLLGLLAGVFAVHRLAVKNAHTATVGRRAVTSWTVIPEFGEPPGTQRLREDIRRALDGTLDLSAALDKRRQAQRPRQQRVPAAPTVELLDAEATDAVVMEIRAQDAPGLLHAVATSVAAAGVQIDSAMVSTLGSEVVDVFYLRGGDRVTTQHEHVAQAVTAALEALTNP